MREPCTVEWKQHVVGSMPMNCWFARVVHPVETVVFAAVGQTLTGTWIITFTPKGRQLDKPETSIGPYKTREKAMLQVERWASYHWRTVPVAAPPRHFVGSGLSRR